MNSAVSLGLFTTVWDACGFQSGRFHVLCDFAIYPDLSLAGSSSKVV